MPRDALVRFRTFFNWILNERRDLKICGAGVLPACLGRRNKRNRGNINTFHPQNNIENASEIRLDIGDSRIVFMPVVG